jgi:hypothetical protein
VVESAAALVETPAAVDAEFVPTITLNARACAWELVDYTKAGDTLSLAVPLCASVEEIRLANPIPEIVTTMPPGMPMKIPIYYAHSGARHHRSSGQPVRLRTSELGLMCRAYVDSQPGWLARLRYALGDNRTGAEVVALAAQNYSISPRFAVGDARIPV